MSHTITRFNKEVELYPDFLLGKKIWLITDTHFNHKHIIEYENRPVNFKELIIENCKKMIKEEDVLIHLGDVIFSKPSELTEILEQIPGFKILVRGNHDVKKKKWFLDHGFDLVVDALYHPNGVIYSHEPFDIFGRADYNIHGHFHRAVRTESDRTAKGYDFYTKNHAYLSVEEENYKPITLIDFIKRQVKKEENDIT